MTAAAPPIFFTPPKRIQICQDCRCDLEHYACHDYGFTRDPGFRPEHKPECSMPPEPKRGTFFGAKTGQTSTWITVTRPWPETDAEKAQATAFALRFPEAMKVAPVSNAEFVDMMKELGVKSEKLTAGAEPAHDQGHGKKRRVSRLRKTKRR